MDAILPVVISKGASLLKRGRSFLFSKPVSSNCRTLIKLLKGT